MRRLDYNPTGLSGHGCQRYGAVEAVRIGLLVAFQI